MDQKLPQASEDHQRGLKTGYGVDSPAHTGKPGRRQKRREQPEEPIALLYKTLHHFLPDLSRQMNALPDPRRKEQVVYSQAHLLWLGMLLYMSHLGSRRQLRFERQGERFGTNLAKLSGQGGLDFVADPDTLAYYAEQADLPAMEKLLAKGVAARLIRMRALDTFRLYGFLTVAIDGTQMKTFSSEPWPGCPCRKLADGRKQYFAYVLDAKLVTPFGLTITLASEWLTNEGNSAFDKQDCELKAFPRLVGKLKAFFPRTAFCLLLDGLYANQNAIRIIEHNRWKYIVTLKDGSMPERFEEALRLRELQQSNRIKLRNDKNIQSMSWAEALPIAEFTPDVLFCREQEPGGKQTVFVWLTNFHLNKNNVDNIANKGGRLRWKIENEGFNVPKNNGYEMEHAYSKHPNGLRTFYILLQIAYIINQLILHGSLIKSLCKTFGSAKNFARRLAESLRNHMLPHDLPMPGQIRFVPP